jgi:hypothetical protein
MAFGRTTNCLIRLFSLQRDHLHRDVARIREVEMETFQTQVDLLIRASMGDSRPAPVKVPRTEAVADAAPEKHKSFLHEIHECFGITGTIIEFRQTGGASVNAIRVNFWDDRVDGEGNTRAGADVIGKTI